MASSITALQNKARTVMPGNAAMQAVGAAAPISQGTQQEGLRKLVQSAVTGKQATSSSGPQASNIQEVQAQRAAQLQQEQLQTQVQNQDIAQSQAQDEAWMQLDDAEFGVREQAASLKQGIQQKLSELLTQFSNSKGEIDLNREKATVEQAGFYLRLGNEKYITKLKTEGAKARLDSDARFKEEMMRSIFENQHRLLTEDLRLRSLLRADEREFMRKLGAMDIEMATELLASELDAGQEQMLYQGGANIISGAAEGVAMLPKSTPASTTTSTTKVTTGEPNNPDFNRTA